MEFKKKYWYGITAGTILLVMTLLILRETRFFVPFIVISFTLGWSQVWIDYFLSLQNRKKYEARFLDFVRNLVGAIKSGMPVPRAIVHIATQSDFGELNPHIKKLSNQIEWSIPVHKALKHFALSTDNDIIKRAISTVIEAEVAGGNMEDVLESITISLVEIKKIKEQRRASIHSQVLQSYIIFFVFISIMVVIQNVLVPYIGKMSGGNILQGDIAQAEFTGLASKINIDFSSVPLLLSSLKGWLASLQGIFLSLALIQGLFAGIIIGKLAEGEITSGLKHSLILMTIAFVVMSFFQG